MDIPSVSIRWWKLNIPWCPSWRVGELSLVPWTNYKFLPSTNRGYDICGTAVSSANDATPQPCDAYKWRSEEQDNMELWSTQNIWNMATEEVTNLREEFHIGIGTEINENSEKNIVKSLKSDDSSQWITPPLKHDDSLTESQMNKLKH